MYQCSVCSFQSMYKYNVDRHEKVKHSKPNFNAHTINNDVTHQTGSGAEQTAPSQPEKENHSNVQEESVEQLYENIDQWQKAYDTLNKQFQQVEKVTSRNDGRPSHVSIQLYDKCCKALNDYINLCQGLGTQCQRLNTQKEQQLDRFCTAWEDLKWERDSFAKEINRRDCCGEGYLDKKMAKKVRSGKYWGSE